MTFAETLKAARTKANKSVAECADLAGINRDAWHKYEQGERHPHLLHLPQIAKAVGVTVEKLVSDI
tara:strand:- start:273 stop:470 length:198 start_codon:yes stop_codon:yes gene_type:complete